MSRASSSDDDLALVRRAVARDPKALRVLVGRLSCVPPMVSVCASRSGHRLDEHDRRDLSQAVVLAIWKKLDTFSGRARLETWVYRFCFLELRWFLRKRGRGTSSIEEVAEVSEPSIEGSELDQWELEKIYSALEELETEVAEVVKLKHFEELSFPQIAEQLGVSPNTAKSRYYRGLLKLRTRLASLMDSATTERKR